MTIDDAKDALSPWKGSGRHRAVIEVVASAAASGSGALVPVGWRGCSSLQLRRRPTRAPNRTLQLLQETS